MPDERTDKMKIYTIGHSTRPIGEFISLLQLNSVKQLIDIRTIPKSRRHPQFSTEALAESLLVNGIDYLHMKALGGLRKPTPDSVNTGWRNASFRGYADYMQTPEFEEALQRALQLAARKPTALMCAEAVPWRCHRSLVSDALAIRGIEVREIINASSPKEHELTPFALAEGMKITYPKSASGKQLTLLQ